MGSPSRPAPPATRWSSQRGAVLIHVAIAMVGLTGFSALVIDYGVLWSARRQAQNAADAAALAAATSIGYVDAYDQTRARTAAINSGLTNPVWGVPTVINGGDVTFYDPCDLGGSPDGICVRVDVFRNQTHNNPLPTIFGQLVGILDQGVQATATAKVRFGATTTCVKPIAIPDKWVEHNPDDDPWTTDSQFDGYAKGVPLVPGDQFFPRVGDDPGSGYDLTPGAEGSDYGLPLTIKPPTGHNNLEPGFYGLLRFLGYQGGSYIHDAITGCNPTEVNVGDLIGVEPGATVGPVTSAFDEIIARDPTAEWDDDLGVVSIYGVSPRIVPIVAFDPAVWDSDPNGGPGGIDPTGNANNGPGSVRVTQILGAFIEGTQGNRITARLVPYTDTGFTGGGALPGEANVIHIILVR